LVIPSKNYTGSHESPKKSTGISGVTDSSFRRISISRYSDNSGGSASIQNIPTPSEAMLNFGRILLP